MGEINVKLGNIVENCSVYTIGLDEYGSGEALASVGLFRNYPEALVKFASVCCIIFSIIGIPGNLVTMIALTRCKKVRNATAIFIINLSLSDLLFCCFNLPLAASTFWQRSWTHGILLCRLFPLVRYALVAVSIFTVLAITFNRYVMISHPTLYPKLYKNRNLYIMIAVIWILSFGAFIATYFEAWGRFSLDCITGSCTIVPDEKNRSPKKFVFIAAFILPSIAIILCYARILWIVKKTAKNSRSPIRMTKLEETNTDVPDNTLPSSPKEPERRKDGKSRLTVPCFYSPELSSSCDDSSTKEEGDKKCAPEFKPSTPNSDNAKRIRQSFIATFRKSTAYIKPRMPTKKDKKLLTMIVAIITSFCVCHLPITLTKTIFQEIPGDSSSHPYANIAGYVLIYLTPCINPIIYVVMSSEYRQAYKNCLNCGQCQFFDLFCLKHKLHIYP